MEQASPFRAAGVFNGVAGSLVGQVPYGVLTFGSYEVYKKLLLERLPNVKPIFSYALAAIMGDLTGSGWLCPSEVVKQQTQAGMYASTGEAIRGIWQKKGLVGMYEGYFGGVARDVPFRVAQLTSFELTKNLALRIKKKKRDAMMKKGELTKVESLELSSLEAAVCGAISGSFSAAITAPLDRIKTLLMTDSAAYGGSVASCAAKIWTEEGPAGFLTGVGPRVVYIAPSVVIFFVCYEQVQQRLKRKRGKLV
jgi:solute carrier family 25 S-adenosylmethionine transporter 26